MLSIKNVSLSLLCVALTVQSIVMHVSRTDRAPGVPLYKPAAAVILTECGKLLVSLLLAWRECRDALKVEARQAVSAAVGRNGSERESAEKEGLLDGNSSDGQAQASLDAASRSSSSSHAVTASTQAISRKDVIQRIKEDVFGPDWYKLSIPAMLFTGQSNLAYYASSNLSVPVFQITYQLKIPATALCSVLMLRRALSNIQWLSIALLSLGVGVVQLASSHADAKYHVHSHDDNDDKLHTIDVVAGSKAAAARLLLGRASEAVPEQGMNQLLGLLAVVLACLSSGFSGVYFEKVLKKKAPPPPPSVSADTASPGEVFTSVPVRKTGLWVRNIQLSLFSLLVGSFIYLLTAQSSSLLLPSMFLEGFTSIVYLVVALQVLGGLLAAIVIQYADNISKTFSASMSIILSFGASIWLFDYRLNMGIVLGSAMVLGATWLFNYVPTQKPVPEGEDGQSLLPLSGTRS